MKLALFFTFGVSLKTWYDAGLIIRDTALYNSKNGFHELQWTGPRLGVFTLKATAEDTQGNIASTEMDVWYFCFVPE